MNLWEHFCENTSHFVLERFSLLPQISVFSFIWSPINTTYNSTSNYNTNKYNTKINNILYKNYKLTKEKDSTDCI